MRPPPLFTPHLHLLLPILVSSLRISDIDVPRYHLSGKDLQLNCTYKHESETNDPLYSVKWYRDVEHFYEFVPTRKPQHKSFQFRGLKVNLNKSKKSSVVLTDVNKSTSGVFRCEVMGDKPYFVTESKSANMTVIEPPQWGPQIRGMKDNSQVRVHDRVRLWCSVSASWPRSNLSWFVNGHRHYAVTRGTSLHQTIDALGRQILETNLDLELEPKWFIGGAVRVECRASVLKVWHRSHAIVLLDEQRPKPAGIGWWFSSGCAVAIPHSSSLWVIALTLYFFVPHRLE